MKYPPLPKELIGYGGLVRVVRARTITYNTFDCNGLWDPDSRTITIRLGLSRERAWWVYFHERTHVELDDAKIRLSMAKEEAICDAMANARLAELRTRLSYEAARNRPRSSGTRSATGNTK